MTAYRRPALLEPSLPARRMLRLSLVAALIIIFLRTPQLLLQGRVYAEEGCVYFHYAWNVSFWKGLLALHQGYLSLNVNVVTDIAAHILPFSWLAQLLVWSALAVQLWVAYLVLTCECLTSLAQRLLGMAVFLLASPNLETWLNAITVQFILGTGTAVVLISRAENRQKQRYAFLAIAGLNGVYSCVLLPLFWLRSLRLKTRATVLQAAVLSIAAMIQLVCVLSARRVIAVHQFQLLGAIVLEKVFLLPFLSRIAAKVYSDALLAHTSTGFLMACDAAIAVILALMLALVWTSVPARWLFVCFIISDAVGWWGAPDTGKSFLLLANGGRYLLTGNTLLGLALVVALGQVKEPSFSNVSRWRRYALALLILCFCLSGTADFIRYRRALDTFPNWQKQATAWKTDPALNFSVYPAGFHPFHLSPTHNEDPDEIEPNLP